MSWFQVLGQAMPREGEVSRKGHKLGPGHVGCEVSTRRQAYGKFGYVDLEFGGADGARERNISNKEGGETQSS